MVEKVMVEKREVKRKLSNIPRKGIYYESTIINFLAVFILGVSKTELLKKGLAQPKTWIPIPDTSQGQTSARIAEKTVIVQIAKGGKGIERLLFSKSKWDPSVVCTNTSE